MIKCIKTNVLLIHVLITNIDKHIIMKYHRLRVVKLHCYLLSYFSFIIPQLINQLSNLFIKDQIALYVHLISFFIRNSHHLSLTIPFDHRMKVLIIINNLSKFLANNISFYESE